MFLPLVSVWAAYIASAIFRRRSVASIASGLHVGLFTTAAFIYLIGAVLIITFVGSLVILVAQVLQTIAFFSLPARTPATSDSPSGGVRVLPRIAPSHMSPPGGL